jgi:hypothetical protein
MGLYQHPHLTRGVVHTPEGAFSINRGIVELPDELGESLGWTPVTSDGDGEPALAGLRMTPPHDYRSDVRADRPR